MELDLKNLNTFYRNRPRAHIMWAEQSGVCTAAHEIHKDYLLMIHSARLHNAHTTLTHILKESLASNLWAFLMRKTAIIIMKNMQRNQPNSVSISSVFDVFSSENEIGSFGFLSFILYFFCCSASSPWSSKSKTFSPKDTQRQNLRWKFSVFVSFRLAIFSCCCRFFCLQIFIDKIS